MSPFIAIISCLIILIIVFQKQIMSLGSILVLIIAPFLILCPSINYFYLLNDNFINTIKITINNLLYVLPMFLILLILSSVIICKHKNIFMKPLKNRVEINCQNVHYLTLFLFVQGYS